MFFHIVWHLIIISNQSNFDLNIFDFLFRLSTHVNALINTPVFKLLDADYCTILGNVMISSQSDPLLAILASSLTLTCLSLIKSTLYPNLVRILKDPGNRADWIISVAAAEARNAEGARMSTLRISNPPFLTSKDTWVQLMSLRVELAIFSSAMRCKSSNWMSAGFEVQSEALKTYNILVEPNECLRMIMERNKCHPIRSSLEVPAPLKQHLPGHQELVPHVTFDHGTRYAT